MAATSIFIGEPWSGSFVWNDDQGVPRPEAVGSTVHGYIKHRLTGETVTPIGIGWTNAALGEGEISMTEEQTALIPQGLVSELVIKIENGAFKETIFDLERNDGIKGILI